MNATSPLMLAAVALGGMAGALARHLVGVAFVHRHWYGLPAATLVVNVAGCLLAGLLLVWIDTRLAHQPLLRNLLIVGFLGALTTFSALGVELWQMLRADRVALALTTAAAHLVLGVAAVALGWHLGRWLFVRG